MTRATPIAALFALLCAAAACDVADDAGACFDTSAMTPRAGYVNAGYLNAGYMNSGYLNSGYVNAGYINASTMNGRWLNGVGFNGSTMQGAKLQGLTLAGFDHLVLQGTTLALVDVDGRLVAPPEALVGVSLPTGDGEGGTLALRVDAVRRDGDADITYYALSLDGDNLCGPDGEGLFVAGRWDDDGDHHDRDEGGDDLTFACTDGVIAKCVMWGYAPAELGADAHQTCTRMARADYCGEGIPFTQNGTEIDVFDRLGVQRPDPSLDVVFEAGWGPDGAVCVHAPRYEIVDAEGEAIVPECWDALPKCADEGEAIALGAMISNASHNETRQVCGGG